MEAVRPVSGAKSARGQPVEGVKCADLAFREEG
jgi:hypothetical protein